MISRVVYILSVVLMCYTSLVFYPRWTKPDSEAAISWDVSGYYWYLPSVFIYHDLKHQAFTDSVIAKYKPTNTEFQQRTQAPNGNYVIKYSSGLAIMFLPFFTAAHLAAGALGYPRDGFSAPYQLGIQLGGLLVALIGLWYLRKFLLLYYSDRVTAIVLSLLVIGTNYLNYAAVDCGMSHSWLFTVYVLLLLSTHYYYKEFKLKYALAIGFLTGLAVLTRPTDIVACIIPLLWGMQSFSGRAFVDQLGLLRKNTATLSAAVLVAFSVVFVQLIYWKYVSGHWLYYSYGSQSFTFYKPHMYQYSFSPRTGWLRYTPMFLLSFAGILPYLKRGHHKAAVLVFFFVNFYVVCAWDVWWYGGRAMVQSYPVIILPMATLVETALRRKTVARILAGLVALFVYMNVWITWMYHKGNLYDSDSMNSNYYWRVAGRWSAPDSVRMLMDKCDFFTGDPTTERLLYHNDFERATGPWYTTNAISGHQSVMLNKDVQVTPAYRVSCESDSIGWIRVKSTFRCANKEWDVWKMAHAIVRLRDSRKPGACIQEGFIKADRILSNGETREIAFYIRTTKARYDAIEVFYWNAGSEQTITIDDLDIRTFGR